MNFRYLSLFTYRKKLRDIEFQASLGCMVKDTHIHTHGSHYYMYSVYIQVPY